MRRIRHLDKNAVENLLSSVNSRELIGGLSHCFYRYPACFTPSFARNVIETFTEPGSLVIDPFMGGGTTLVEASALSRHSFGGDISELATFVTRAKTAKYYESDCKQLRDWMEGVVDALRVTVKTKRQTEWELEGYFRNVDCATTWRLRKILHVLLNAIDELPSPKLQRFARCLALRTGKWAFESNSEPPSVEMFRKQLRSYCEEMLSGAKKYQLAASAGGSRVNTRCVSAVSFASHLPAKQASLVLTSPPYPGVYMPYHRWKVFGRWESPVPFWVAGARDGKPMPHYILGSRIEPGLETYYRRLERSFSNLRNAMRQDAWVVQLVGFKDPTWQLPKYLETMKTAGYQEVRDDRLATAADGRLWRTVPRRRWYATYQDSTKDTAREVVLFHVQIR